jgi:hypothetical protein
MNSLTRIEPVFVFNNCVALFEEKRKIYKNHRGVVEHDVTRQLSSHILMPSCHFRDEKRWPQCQSRSLQCIYVINSNHKRQYLSVSGCEKMGLSPPFTPTVLLIFWRIAHLK